MCIVDDLGTTCHMKKKADVLPCKSWMNEMIT